MPPLSPEHLLPKVTVIDFDDVPDGTAIDNHYAAKGVTFASVIDQPQSRSSAFAREWPTARTKQNVVSVNAPPIVPFFDASVAGIEATFAAPQRFVSIAAKAVTLAEDIGQMFVHKPYIESFDTQRDFLQIAYYGPSYGDPAYGDWQTLTLISSSANISFVRFSSQWHNQPPHVFAFFDHMVFSERVPINLLGPRVSPLLP